MIERKTIIKPWWIQDFGIGGAPVWIVGASLKRGVPGQMAKNVLNRMDPPL